MYDVRCCTHLLTSILYHRLRQEEEDRIQKENEEKEKEELDKKRRETEEQQKRILGEQLLVEEKRRKEAKVSNPTLPFIFCISFSISSFSFTSNTINPNQQVNSAILVAIVFNLFFIIIFHLLMR